MSSLLMLSVGAFMATVILMVVLVWYLEKRLADTGRHLEELYGQLEAMLWKLE